MPTDETKSDYQKLVQKWSSPPAAQKSAEQNLDALLAARSGAAAEPVSAVALEPAAPLSWMDALRRLISRELIPVFEDIKAKYESYGIALSMDVSDFLQGGRGVVIKFDTPPRSIELEGTVINEGIAFNEIQSYGGVPGAICSGPMLRVRRLTAEAFRDFICAQLAPLVRTKLRQK